MDAGTLSAIENGLVASGIAGSYKVTPEELAILSGREIIGRETGYWLESAGFVETLNYVILGYIAFGSALENSNPNGMRGSRANESNIETGYHATKPEYVESIRANGFRNSTAGRAGGSGVYVNNTPEGAIAEYSKYNPYGPIPEVLEVKYQTGVNVLIENPGNHIQGALPIFGDTLTFESTQLPGTYNTIVRNGTIFFD